MSLWDDRRIYQRHRHRDTNRGNEKAKGGRPCHASGRCVRKVVGVAPNTARSGYGVVVWWNEISLLEFYAIFVGPFTTSGSIRRSSTSRCVIEPVETLRTESSTMPGASVLDRWFGYGFQTHPSQPGLFLSAFIVHISPSLSLFHSHSSFSLPVEREAGKLSHL